MTAAVVAPSPSRSVLIEMGRVLRAVPRPDAPAREVAAWFECKAQLLEHIAQAGGPESMQVRVAAAQARRRAARLLSEVRPWDGTR